MEKNYKRVLIKYLHMKGLSVHQIYLDMKEVLGDHAPSQATVYRWTGALQQGWQSTEDVHHSGRPSDAYTDENVNSVQDMIVKDRRLTVRHVAQCLTLSTGTTHIISDVLGYNKVYACWVPRMLTAEIMHIRMQTFSHNIKLYIADPAKFSSSICDYEQDHGSPLQPRNQTTEYAVETLHFTSSSQVLQDHLSQQGYDICILGQ